MSAAVLELKRVARCFLTPRGAVEVLRDVTLAVEAGEFLGVVGASGAGKTTLLHICALLDRPSAGRVLLDGTPVDYVDDAKLACHRAERIGMVFQAHHLLPQRTVLDNVAFRFRHLGVPLEEARVRARAALERVGIGALAERRAWWLSGGEAARAALARAIAHPPRLLVADEPTGNLDGKSADALLALLAELNRDGMTVLLVTHNPAMLRHCTRTYACREGALAEAA